MFLVLRLLAEAMLSKRDTLPFSLLIVGVSSMVTGCNQVSSSAKSNLTAKPIPAPLVDFKFPEHLNILLS
jgi:hypothetical protein